MTAPELVVHDGVVAGNPYDKYGSRNPITRRLMAGFDRGLFELLTLAGPFRSLLEVGCGEGHVLAKVAQRFPHSRLLGTDFSPEIVAVARERHPHLGFEAQSIYDTAERREGWDVVIACEVFEHLDEPERALATLSNVAARAIVLTVPREPLWRILNVLRGAHLARLGDSHGHVQHWSRGAFVRFVSKFGEVAAVRTPLPWTQVLIRPRRSAA